MEGPRSSHDSGRESGFLDDFFRKKGDTMFRRMGVMYVMETSDRMSRTYDAVLTFAMRPMRGCPCRLAGLSGYDETQTATL